MPNKNQKQPSTVSNIILAIAAIAFVLILQLVLDEPSDDQAERDTYAAAAQLELDAQALCERLTDTSGYTATHIWSASNRLLCFQNIRAQAAQ